MRSRAFWRTGVVLHAVLVGLLVVKPAGAHGVDVTADFGDGIVSLDLTDETGEVCVRAEEADEAVAALVIAELSTDEVVLDLGEGLGPTERCQFLDAPIVDAILGDVDGYVLVRTRSDGTVDQAPLRKPLPPESETALGATAEPGDEDDGPNPLLVFGIGAAAGVGIVVVRKRLSRGVRS